MLQYLIITRKVFKINNLINKIGKYFHHKKKQAKTNAFILIILYIKVNKICFLELKGIMNTIQMV